MNHLTTASRMGRLALFAAPACAAGVALSLMSAPALASGDTEDTATPIALGTTTTEFLEHETDVDWYRVTVPRRVRLYVTLSDQPKGAALHLYERGENELDSTYSQWTDNPPAVSVDARVEQGTYYVKVECDDHADTGRPYQLNVRGVDVPDDWGPDTKYAARVIAPGAAVQETLDRETDQDWYRFTVNSRSRVSVTLSNQPSSTKIELYDADQVGGDLIDSAYSDSTDSPAAQRVFTTLGAGTYFVNVEAARYNWSQSDEMRYYSLVVNSQALEVAPKSVEAKLTAVKRRSKLRLDVNPDVPGKQYQFTVQKKRKRGWRDVNTYTTKGAGSARTINMRKGTYRAVVAASAGYTGDVSNRVRIRR
ncbi:MAG: PPC domain-containing protein [Actinobacteria bacterium]|nr:PPC domain-containing protein [Actinomycetota bacterium]